MTRLYIMKVINLSSLISFYLSDKISTPLSSVSTVQLALNRAGGNIADQVARYNRINLFYKQFQASVRISYKNVP